MTKNNLLIVICVILAVISGCAVDRECGRKQSTLDRFASFDGNHPPAQDWQGPVFELSQDYPLDEPPREEYRWENIDYTKNPGGYLTEVLRYVYEGNIEVDWVVQKNPARRWFHAPWMHAAEIKKDTITNESCRSEKGREFIHGLTRERSTSLAELNFADQANRSCVNDIENWAVSVYNAPGGFVIRQVWEEMTVKGRLPSPEKLPTDFPDGTVVVKLLFTAAKPSEVSYLAGSPEWRADILRNGVPTTVRLLQVDVAVRDRRADRDEKATDKKGSGWIFGTFVYDKDATPVFEDGKDSTLAWRRLKPIGLMFGNEPHQTLLVDQGITQTQHLGCGQRLAGPVDNLSSSCLACHAQAEVLGGDRPFVAINYKANDKNPNSQCRCQSDVAHWFRTLGAKEPFTKGAVPLGFSLQLSNGIFRFCQHNPGQCPPDPDRRLATPDLKPCSRIVPPAQCPSPQTGASENCSQAAASAFSASAIVDSPGSSSGETARGGDVDELILKQETQINKSKRQH